MVVEQLAAWPAATIAGMYTGIHTESYSRVLQDIFIWGWQQADESAASYAASSPLPSPMSKPLCRVGPLLYHITALRCPINRQEVMGIGTVGNVYLFFGVSLI